MRPAVSVTPVAAVLAGCAGDARSLQEPAFARPPIHIADEGAHTVCIADTCGRVFTLAADAESPEEVIAQIEEALRSSESRRCIGGGAETAH